MLAGFPFFIKGDLKIFRNAPPLFVRVEKKTFYLYTKPTVPFFGNRRQS